MLALRKGNHMQLNTIATIVAILAPLFALVSFGIKAFTGSPADRWFYERIHYHNTHRSQSSPQPYIVDTPPPPDSARVSPPQPPPLPGTSPAQQGSPAKQTPKRSLRRLIPHPWVLGASLLSLLLVSVPTALALSSDLSLVLADVGFLVFLGATISGAVSAARERHWVWFIVVLLTIGWGLIPFCIFDRPRKRGLAPAVGIGDRQ